MLAIADVPKYAMGIVCLAERLAIINNKNIVEIRDKAKRVDNKLLVPLE